MIAYVALSLYLPGFSFVQGGEPEDVPVLINMLQINATSERVKLYFYNNATTKSVKPVIGGLMLQPKEFKSVTGAGRNRQKC